VRPVTAADEEHWVGERLFWRAADHPSAQRGEAFGLFLGDKLIAELITHDPAVAEMAHLIATDGIEVSGEYRGQGHGKALLAHWTREMQARGRVCIHSASAANTASIALAKSVGYVEYARVRGVTYSLARDK
jgi:ribosomal protein S18 acetylase RimI-like enzyme